MPMTLEEIAQAITDNAKLKPAKWLSCAFQLDCPKAADGTGQLSVGVKAYGRWVQRIQCAGLVDGIPEQRTLKALKAEVITLLGAMVASL